jgi:hypothetical protein
MKAETTYGTPVTVDRFLEIQSEDIEINSVSIDVPVLGTQYLKTSQVSRYTKDATGNTVMPVMSKGFGVPFKQMLGSSATAQVGGTAEYKHTFTPDTSGGQGVSATVQIGRPDVGGTVRPFTFEGGKVTKWEIAIDRTGVMMLTLTWDFENVLTATALATPSYASGRQQFIWTNASATLGGNATFLRSLTLSGERAFDLERTGLSVPTKKEPILNGISNVMGAAEGEFESLTNYNAFIAGTQQALVITATTGTSLIPTTANPYKIVITVAACDLVAPGTPKVGGPEILTMPLNFRGLDNGTDAVVKIEYHNDETTI